jgi:hypothetical protein
MSVYNISYKEIIPDTAFRSLYSPATNNNIQIINFIKNTFINVKKDNYSNYTTTFKSNSPKIKSYTKNRNKIEYNITHLNVFNNNFRKNVGIQYPSCESEGDCVLCGDPEINNPCKWSVDFNPSFESESIIGDVPGTHNNWIIQKENLGPLNQSEQEITFDVATWESEPGFSLQIYLRTRYCQEATYVFESETRSLVDSFYTPVFLNSEDYLVEFIFTINTNDCQGDITYIDSEYGYYNTCETTTTTQVSTPTPTPTYETPTPTPTP